MYRFDVSSVHPKFKTAGGYTEIPYDKNYMDDLEAQPYQIMSLRSRFLVKFLRRYCSKSETPLSMQKASSDESADMVQNESFEESSPDTKEEQALIQKAESEDLSISVPPNSVCYVGGTKISLYKKKKDRKVDEDSL
ncbi:hypothetical protein Btru_046731 [Bulinus truncatus]|nr:hypothetical protein Btru_046731 [Bulinus truncatus]